MVPWDLSKETTIQCGGKTMHVGVSGGCQHGSNVSVNPVYFALILHPLLHLLEGSRRLLLHV